MPPNLSKAIDNISYGCLEKVWITFPSTFWDGFPGETLFLRPEYAPDTNPNCWNQGMVSWWHSRPLVPSWPSCSIFTAETPKQSPAPSRIWIPTLMSIMTFSTSFSSRATPDCQGFLIHPRTAFPKPSSALTGSTIAGRVTADTRISR